MKSIKSAPLLLLSVLLAASTALSGNSFAACSSCGKSQAPAAPAPQYQTASSLSDDYIIEPTTNRVISRHTIFEENRPRPVVKRSLFGPAHVVDAPDSQDWRTVARGPIFGDNDCSREGGPIFGDNTCTKRKCGGAMFGPQTCEKPDLPCESCEKKVLPPAPQRAYIQNFKELPPEPVFERIHKCSDLAPIQLEWVDFRLPDKNSESYSRKLGNYRFRLFGCRRFSKNTMLNEGRIIQKDMQFIDIFEDLVRDCYNILKVPNDLCLRDQDYEAPEYILTAEITDYFMNVCDGYDWDNAEKTDKRTGSAEMTVTWRLLDLTKTKVIWKGKTTGYSDLDDGLYNGEMDLIERAFADAVLNLKGMPEFEDQLAQRVPAKVIAQQKSTLLAIEQASDPIKCKIDIPQATSCPIPADMDPDMQQCTMPAEIVQYGPQDFDTIPLESIPLVNNEPIINTEPAPYIEETNNMCYGNIDNSYPYQECDGTLVNYIMPTENACDNPMFAYIGEGCDPSLNSFMIVKQECIPFEKVIEEPAPQICLFEEPLVTIGGISKDSGYVIPETEVIEPVQEVKPTADWQPYEEETEQRQPESIVEDSGITENQLPEVELKEEGNYRTADHFCIENIAPFPDMRPENLYRVRASMMSVKDKNGKQSAGLLIADDLILTSADAVDESVPTYEIETINSVKATANIVRVNVKKNIALLKTTSKMEFRPLSLNLDLPPVGQGGYMSLGLLNNAEGENYLDDKGKIKGYRYSDQMGTEIITDTFVQTVSSGGALIDEKGVINGLASHNQKFDDKGDLFLPIQDAINSVGLEVCGQAEPFKQAPMAVKPVSSAIDNYKGSKEPAVMAKNKRK